MTESEQVHATAVAIQTRAVLITGASGSGKSTLGLEMIALGADLVSDDRVDLECQDGRVIARAPHQIKGLIEARGVGLIRMPFVPKAEIALIVDLNYHESERLPPIRNRPLLGVDCRVIFGKHREGLAGVLVNALRFGIAPLD